MAHSYRSDPPFGGFVRSGDGKRAPGASVSSVRSRPAPPARPRLDVGLAPASRRHRLSYWLTVNIWFAPAVHVTGPFTRFALSTSTETPQMFAAALIGIVTAT